MYFVQIELSILRLYRLYNVEKIVICKHPRNSAKQVFCKQIRLTLRLACSLMCRTSVIALVIAKILAHPVGAV